MTTYLAEIEKIVGCEGVTVKRRQCADKDNQRNPMTRYLTVFDIRKGEPTNSLIGSFSLTQLPGCCGVCVSYHTTITPSLQRKGLGKLLMKMKEQIAFLNGYSIMMGTDRVSNTYQQKIFKASKWSEVARFVNKRTWNDVGVYIRPLTDTQIPLGFPHESIIILSM